MSVVNPNQSNDSSKPQRSQTTQWTNQNFKQIHVAATKNHKGLENMCERVSIDFGFTSDYSVIWQSGEKVWTPIAYVQLRPRASGVTN